MAGKIRLRPHHARTGDRSGLTLIEVIVVITIIGILAALLLPALHSGREAARRVECANHLKQLGLACQSYVAANSVMPAPLSMPVWQFALLPYLEQGARYASFNFTDDGLEFFAANQTAESGHLAIYVCPADGGGTINYGANLGTWLLDTPDRGAFSRQQAVVYADIADGTSSTSAFSEMPSSHFPESREERQLVTSSLYRYRHGAKVDDFVDDCFRTPNLEAENFWPARCWFWARPHVGDSLYDHTLPINRRSCKNAGQEWNGAYSAGSYHAVGGAHSVFVDGHVSFVKDSIQLAVWRALGTRNGGEAVSIPD